MASRDRSTAIDATDFFVKCLARRSVTTGSLAGCNPTDLLAPLMLSADLSEQSKGKFAVVVADFAAGLTVRVIGVERTVEMVAC